jgi:hypothetical protein
MAEPKSFFGTNPSATAVPIVALRWYRFAYTINSYCKFTLYLSNFIYLLEKIDWAHSQRQKPIPVLFD